ncbi:MAG TPA: 30S ribosomal protein S20, partial [Chloroflexota bacterium]
VVRDAVRALDKAAQKGIVHRNAAARRKSRLMSRLHQLSVAPAPAPDSEAKPKTPARRGASARAATGAKKPTTRRSTATTATRKPSTRTSK